MKSAGSDPLRLVKMSRFLTLNLRTLLDPNGRPARVVTFVARQPSWVSRLALAVSFIAMMAVALVLIIPAVVLGVAAFLLAAAYATVRRWLSVQHRPNGALDGRRNVRVIVHDEGRSV
jgi:hypothetical protein